MTRASAVDPPVGRKGAPERYDVEVDARGLLCPLPVLRLASALRGRSPGAVALLQATDPASVTDVDAYCRETRSSVLSRWRENGIYFFLVEKAGQSGDRDPARSG